MDRPFARRSIAADRQHENNFSGLGDGRHHPLLEPEMLDGRQGHLDPLCERSRHYNVHEAQGTVAVDRNLLREIDGIGAMR